MLCVRIYLHNFITIYIFSGLSAYVRMEIVNFPFDRISYSNISNSRVFALIWTTTPWTLPLNDAIAYNERECYCLLRDRHSVENCFYIVNKQSLCRLNEVLPSERFELCVEFGGHVLSGVLYSTKIGKIGVKPFLTSTHVASDKGNGKYKLFYAVFFVPDKLLRFHTIH